LGKEIIAIVAEGCEGCEELLSRMKARNIKMRVMDVTKSLEAARIVRDLGIDRVPTLVAVETTETGTTYCTVDDKGSRCVEASREADS